MIDELRQWEYDRGYEKGKTDMLDKIRAEIDEQIKYNTYFNSDMAKGEIIAFEWVKRKIDEYTKGEGE